MKINQSIGLLTLGIALVSLPGRAQTTPTGAANSTTYPQGAIAEDSAATSKTGGGQKRNRQNRTNRSTTNQNSRTGSGSSSGTTGNQDDRYRQNSATYGTTLNNSNSTNYNSNNVTTAPTGAGSTSTTSGSSTTPRNENDQASGSTSGSASGSMTDGAQKNGTAAAVTGARTTKEPAVKVGSTERNSSVGDFIASSPNYVTLQNAIQSAELNQLLEETGPYTIFAPSNAAFKKLPATMQAGLLEGRNRNALKQLLSYHIVRGSVDAATLTKQIKEGNGKAQLKTLSDNTLTAQLGTDGRIMLTDQQGGTAYVEATDSQQSNGIVHGINAVLLPKVETASFR